MSDEREGGGRAAAMAALVCLFAANVALLGDVWRAGAYDVVPFSPRDSAGEAYTDEVKKLVVSDTVFIAGIAARNAYALLHSPARLFDAEHCAPARTLAFGEPLITMGIVAIPGRLATGDPIAAHNLTLLALLFLGSAAIYVLITDWTGSRAAAVVAAVLYTFTGERVTGISHPFLYDTSWLLFGLFFARRLLAHGRRRDAAGLAVCGALQLGTSVYPVLSSALLALPVAVALAVRMGVGAVPVSRWLGIAAVLALAAYLVFSPFLAVRASQGHVLSRSEQHFASWAWFVPWREGRIPWSAAALAVVALAATATRRERGAVLCWSVAAGAMLVAWASTGPNQGGGAVRLPNLYGALGGVLPGLDAVRVPARVDTGYHAGLSILAGFGAAALLALVPRGRVIAGAALIAVAAVEAASMVYGQGRPFAMEYVAAARDNGRFIESTLGTAGDGGALLELPLGTPAHDFLFQSPPRILAAAYHHRRTSACYGSFLPPGREQLRTDASMLPDPDARERLCAQGFRSAVVHRDGPRGEAIAQRLHAVALEPASGVRSLASNGAVTLFDICANGASGGRLGGTHD